MKFIEYKLRILTNEIIPHAKQKYLTATGCPTLNITRGAAELIDDKSHANPQPTTDNQ